MDKKPETTEYGKKLQQITLSESARSRIAKNLDAYADFHTITTNERVSDSSRSNEEVSQIFTWHTTFFTRLNSTTMPVLGIIAVIFIGGTTSFAAQNSLPGELLYPVKITVNENVRSALALSTDAEARFQADLLEERIEEAAELEAEEKLEGTLATKVRGNIALQTDIANEASAKVSGESRVETERKISLALAKYNSLFLHGDGMLAMETKAPVNTLSREAVSMEMSDGVGGGMYAESDDMAVSSTMLALDPIDDATLQHQTEARIVGLRQALNESKGQIDAEIYTEFQATLDEADDLMIQVMVQSSTDNAREILSEASDLVGKVEASVSSMGTVTIDKETGAIVEIDFSTQPVAEPIMYVDPMPVDLPVSAGSDADIDVDVLEETIEGNISAESSINF